MKRSKNITEIQNRGNQLQIIDYCILIYTVIVVKLFLM
jgi:hypothetical protein